MSDPLAALAAALPRFRVTFRALPSDVPAAMRLRALLKSSLRRHRFRCEAAEELPEPAGREAGTVEPGGTRRRKWPGSREPRVGVCATCGRTDVPRTKGDEAPGFHYSAPPCELPCAGGPLGEPEDHLDGIHPTTCVCRQEPGP